MFARCPHNKSISKRSIKYNFLLEMQVISKQTPVSFDQFVCMLLKQESGHETLNNSWYPLFLDPP